MASLAPTNGTPRAGRSSRERRKWTNVPPNPNVSSWLTKKKATSDIGLSSNSGGGILIVPPTRLSRNPASNNGGSVRWARNANDFDAGVQARLLPHFPPASLLQRLSYLYRTPRKRPLPPRRHALPYQQNAIVLQENPGDPDFVHRRQYTGGLDSVQKYVRRRRLPYPVRAGSTLMTRPEPEVVVMGPAAKRVAGSQSQRRWERSQA